MSVIIIINKCHRASPMNTLEIKNGNGQRVKTKNGKFTKRAYSKVAKGEGNS